MSAIECVEAVNLTRIYGRRFALKDASFQLQSGTVTALIGANGAGKSTAFNLLAGRIKPSRGQITFDGALAEMTTERRRSCGYLSHASFLYGALSGRENLQLVADLYRISADRVSDVLSRVGIAKRADAPARAYSRGMAQRLALGRLLLVQPDVWLLDEPASGLDEAGRKWLATEVRTLADSGRIVAFSSHHRELVCELATHVVVLAGGRVAHAGPAEGADHIRGLFQEHIG